MNEKKEELDTRGSHGLHHSDGDRIAFESRKSDIGSMSCSKPSSDFNAFTGRIVSALCSYDDFIEERPIHSSLVWPIVSLFGSNLVSMLVVNHLSTLRPQTSMRGNLQLRFAKGMFFARVPFHNLDLVLHQGDPIDFVPGRHDPIGRILLAMRCRVLVAQGTKAKVLVREDLEETMNAVDADHRFVSTTRASSLRLGLVDLDLKGLQAGESGESSSLVFLLNIETESAQSRAIGLRLLTRKNLGLSAALSHMKHSRFSTFGTSLFANASASWQCFSLQSILRPTRPERSKGSTF